jgi:SAM-dependent methyltransferase
MIDTTLFHYLALKKVGQSGRGEVFRAEDTNLSRQVALKVLPSIFSDDSDRLKRFERETNHEKGIILHDLRPPKKTFIFLWLLIFCSMLSIAQENKLRVPDVPFEPSPQKVVELMLKLANVHKGDVVYDLGCGDGRIVIKAAKQFGATGVGIDIDPIRITESLQNARKAGVMDRVTFRNEDLFVTNIQEATVVTLFLWRSANLKLRPKLLRELKPGARVVSYYWDMDDWKPDKRIEVDGNPIYIWTIPANKALEKRLGRVARILNSIF